MLFGEVLAKPEWTQPSLSQEEIRKNGGVPPPPQPSLPTEFTLHLYNPDQNIVVRQKTSSWAGSTSYEFSMPQHSFRTPSASTLDRALDDPAFDATTPMINFVWRKEGKFAKDLTCFMTGKSTDITGKKAKKNREPDIAIALFSGLRDITIYETNLYRVDMEDPKGLEVTLLLGAAVIRDLYFGNIKDVFHIGEYTRKNSGGLAKRKTSSPQDPALMQPAMSGRPLPPPQSTPNGAYSSNSLPTRGDRNRQTLPPLQTTPPQAQRPLQDPMERWRLEQETAQLRQQEDELRRGEEARRREREKADEAEARRLKKQLEAEEREARRKQAEIDKETERLRKKYGDQQGLLPTSQQGGRHSAPLPQDPYQRPHTQPRPQYASNGMPMRQSRPPQQPPRPVSYNTQHAQYAPASVPYMSGGTMLAPDNGKKMASKKSFWGLRSHSDDASAKRLSKKQSSMF